MLGIPEYEKEYFSRVRRVKVREKICRLIEAWNIRRTIPNTIEMAPLEIQRAPQGIQLVSGQ